MKREQNIAIVFILLLAGAEGARISQESVLREMQETSAKEMQQFWWNYGNAVCPADKDAAFIETRYMDKVGKLRTTLTKMESQKKISTSTVSMLRELTQRIGAFESCFEVEGIEDVTESKDAGWGLGIVYHNFLQRFLAYVKEAGVVTWPTTETCKFDPEKLEISADLRSTQGSLFGSECNVEAYMEALPQKAKGIAEVMNNMLTKLTQDAAQTGDLTAVEKELLKDLAKPYDSSTTDPNNPTNMAGVGSLMQLQSDTSIIGIDDILIVAIFIAIGIAMSIFMKTRNGGKGMEMSSRDNKWHADHFYRQSDGPGH